MHGPSRSVGARPSSLRFRPTLERLDDRWVPSGFRQTNLVADEPGVAQLTDPSLVDAWGIALNAGGGAFWLSAHGTGVSPLYTGDVTNAAGVTSPVARPFAVALPGGAPTGQVFNGTGQFAVSAGAATGPALFIFASETGFITGWNPAVPAAPSRVSTVAVSRPGEAAYTGLAIGNNGTANFLYAADFQNRRIDVFSSTYAPAMLTGNFTDPGIPERYSPFNIQNLGGRLYVTYARQDRDGNLSNGGNGFVSVFDLNGNFIRRLASNGPLKAPWGLALAPADFGKFNGAVLVGNHGDGRINAFDPTTGRHLGRLEDERGRQVRIDGLWGLAFGNGVTAGDRNALYFAAGPDDGEDGLFGSLRFVPGGGHGHGHGSILVAIRDLIDRLRDRGFFEVRTESVAVRSEAATVLPDMGLEFAAPEAEQTEPAAITRTDARTESGEADPLDDALFTGILLSD